MAVAVNVFVEDTEISPQPITGVVINVYDATTLAFITSGTSDSNGEASFLLPGSVTPGTNYELRFFKAGVIFQNPRTIAVLEPVSAPDSNDFDVSGTLTTLPVATDPRMCRCTGQFINYAGQPVRNSLVRIVAILGSGGLTKPPDTPLPPPYIISPLPAPPSVTTGFQVPKILDGKMVSVESMEFKTDTNGRVSMDLIRQGQYNVSFAGEEDHIWTICIPDRSSANLIELIHPEPKILTWDQTDAPGNAITVSIGETKLVHFSVLFSNHISYAKNLGHIIQFEHTDANTVDVSYMTGEGAVSIMGRTLGTTTILVSVLPEMTPARIPTYAISAVPLAVTVIP